TSVGKSLCEVTHAGMVGLRLPPSSPPGCFCEEGILPDLSASVAEWCRSVRVLAEGLCAASTPFCHLPTTCVWLGASSPEWSPCLAQTPCLYSFPASLKNLSAWGQGSENTRGPSA